MNETSHPVLPNAVLPSNRLPTPYRAEPAVVGKLLESLQGALDWKAVVTLATPWVIAVRDNPAPFWAMESLLREYPLSSSEGLALMRLAESLLRIPDADTAIALTADQLSRANFDAGGGSESPALKRLSDAAIALSKHLLPDVGKEPGVMARLGAKTVVAATLRAVQLMGKQFVLGQDIDEALKEASDQRKNQAVVFSYDMLGEGARTQADAQRYFESYANAIKRIASSLASGGNPQTQDGISIKLSALHPRYEWSHRERVLEELVPRVWTLCEQAARANINLTIDAEEVDRLELSLDVMQALIEKIAQQFPQWRGFGLALQAYQTRASDLIEAVANLARTHQVKLMCRLVKGAYWDAEIKRAQELGMAHYPVFTHKHHSDVSYLACAKAMLDANDVIFAQFATHNAGTIAAIMQLAQRAGCSFELQRLHGMGEGVYCEVLKSSRVSLRVYAPVGAHRDLLAYLVRRLLENGANSSFVHQLTDVSYSIQELLASPLYVSAASGLVLPPELFGPKRKNSAGIDLADSTQRAPLLAAYPDLVIPVVPLSDAKKASEYAQRASLAFGAWSATSVQERAHILFAAAQALEAQMPYFCALLVKEAHKTWGDAVAEVREAVDFLRYYAVQATELMQPQHLPGVTGETNVLQLQARGVWVCISPWNFPLAIFLGQVSAALITGNTVLAKPAEQTPFVAIEAARVLHEAGVPLEALQVLAGPGEAVGAALVAQESIAGVVFTGSTQVAKIIQRSLAAKDGAIVPLIAETGGINAMLVDASALPEQVVDSAIQSAFKSAGQRCSALRLLCVHEGIADRVFDMLRGAADELVTGEAVDLSTDVPPLIDGEAFSAIQTYLRSLTTSTEEYGQGHAIKPQIIELKKVSDLKREVFGPVLHVIRYTGSELALIQEINALGYGLTLGIHTRIDSRALQLAAQARVGNVYVNRNMVGAVVGSQPFGGQGLSGTGPKAGGPHYLPRFCTEQTLTINTAAAGGNAALLASTEAR